MSATPLAGAALAAPSVLGVPIEFLLFAMTLVAVALFQRRALGASLVGLGAIVAWKLGCGGFDAGPGLEGLRRHLAAEWLMLANLLGLLLAFPLLGRHFERSRLPLLLAHRLPAGWTGGLALLAIVFALSAFLDNIAAAIIGGAMAQAAFRARVHVGYVAAIVLAANAGGAGSVVGDTTTTMMWLQGIPPARMLGAYAGAVAAFLVCAIPASRLQHRFSPLLEKDSPVPSPDLVRLVIVAAMLSAAVGASLALRASPGGPWGSLPTLGIAVWVPLLATARLRRPDWECLPDAASGAIFLLALVTSASLLPVARLPAASATSVLALGGISAVFDNIPLTALALKQGGYDWALLAYAVGVGGSMTWFGSSAGVALSGIYPAARSMSLWLGQGWFVVAAYCVGFAVMLGVLGWQPDARSAPRPAVPPPRVMVPIGMNPGAHA